MNEKDGIQIKNITVDKGVPVPEGKWSIWPFSKMEIGDSFSFEKESINSVSSAAVGFAKRSGRKFSRRGTRIWRVG